MLLESERLEGGEVKEDLVFFEILGPDASTYLHNQTPNHIPTQVGTGFPNVFVTNKGVFISAFYLYKKSSECFWAILNRSEKEKFLERLELYHISEDFEVEEWKEEYHILVGERTLDNEYDSEIPYWYYGHRAKIIFESTQVAEINGKALKLFHGFHDDINRKFFTDTRYIDFSYNKDKGCFPGQETVAKIVNNRGAALFPCLLQGERFQNSDLEKGEYIDSFKDYHLVLLPREKRVNRSFVKLNDGKERKVLTFPVLEETAEKWAESLCDIAHAKFHEGKIDEAKKLLIYAIQNKNDYADAYEMLGVILGREDNYVEAIKLMKKLSEVDPSSIMAHTNLSLYYMKIGEIEKAEDEKSKAMLKEFEKAGSSMDQEEEKRRQEEELERKESMYKQVLEIDEEDFIANFGLGEISFLRKKYKEAEKLLSYALNLNSKHSQAYLLLGKTLLALDENDKTKELLKKGIEVAASQGDMMPANEMQSMLNQLS